MQTTDSQVPSPSLENTQPQSLTLSDESNNSSAESIKDEEMKTEPSTKESTTQNNEEGTDILQEVEIIIEKFPEADANRVYALLECRENDKDRVKAVIDILKERHTNDDPGEKADKIKLGGIRRVLSESAVADDPLYKDMLQIAKIFPHTDKNEIYALCEVRV